MRFLPMLWKQFYFHPLHQWYQTKQSERIWEKVNAIEICSFVPLQANKLSPTAADRNRLNRVIIQRRVWTSSDNWSHIDSVLVCLTASLIWSKCQAADDIAPIWRGFSCAPSQDYSSVEAISKVCAHCRGCVVSCEWRWSIGHYPAACTDENGITGCASCVGLLENFSETLGYVWPREI